MVWQPIETAPKDGNCVLVANPKATAFSGFYVAFWSKDDNRWLYSTYTAVPNPTHWMPLPEPPK
jgi:hypothetical protein